MGLTTKRPKLKLSKEEIDILQQKGKSRTLPKHGSRLNLVETLFGKMAGTFLKGIRVESIEELKERIMKGVDEIKAKPVVHSWNKFQFTNSNM